MNSPGGASGRTVAGRLAQVLFSFQPVKLEQALARLLAHAPGEVLNDAEVEKFWLIHKEIQRRRALRETAA
jgi:hypothetical protein